MIRPSTALCGAAIILVGYAMFQVKYEVMQQEEQLAQIRHQIASGREQVRILSAEWGYLTQPSRLDELARRYLDLVPIGTANLGSVEAIPLRNAPPEPAAADRSGTALATLNPSTAP